MNLNFLIILEIIYFQNLMLLGLHNCDNSFLISFKNHEFISESDRILRNHSERDRIVRNHSGFLCPVHRSTQNSYSYLHPSHPSIHPIPSIPPKKQWFVPTGQISSVAVIANDNKQNGREMSCACLVVDEEQTETLLASLICFLCVSSCFVQSFEFFLFLITYTLLPFLFVCFLFWFMLLRFFFACVRVCV